MVAKTIFKQDGAQLYRHIRYEYSYDDRQRLTCKEASKWDGAKGAWMHEKIHKIHKNESTPPCRAFIFVLSLPHTSKTTPMKATMLTLILFFTSLYFCSCSEHRYPRVLLTADSLAQTSPDSALSLLKQLKDSIGREPEETRMYYHLLRIKAQDKAYIAHTSDSLVRQVVRYYRKHKDPKLLPEALYYAGRVYRDLGDAPQALEYFQRAIEAAKGSTNHKLLSLMYSQTGMLFLYQDIYDKAPEMFRKAYHYSTLAQDSIGIVYRLRDIGRSFTTLQQADSAIYYYRKADEQAERIGNLHLRSIVNSELSGYYTDLERYEEAYKAMQVAIVQSKATNLYALYSTIASYYKGNNQLDSATYYYNKMLSANDYIYKKEAYRGLYNIARAKNKNEETFTYLDQYLAYTDSVQSMKQAEIIRKANALYNYQLNQKEAKSFKIQTFKEKRQKVLFGIAFIFSIILFIAYREYHKRKEQNIKTQRQKLDRIQKEQYKQSLAQIEKNRKEIENLEVSLQEATASQDELRHALLCAQKELIEKSNEQIEARQKVQTQAEITLKQSAIYKKFHNLLPQEETNKINNSDWEELNHTIDETYNQFSQRLLEFYPISDIELKVCLLIKIGIPPRQIAALTIRSKQAVTSIRKRLYKKLFDEDGSPEQLDCFIQQF